MAENQAGHRGHIWPWMSFIQIPGIIISGCQLPSERGVAWFAAVSLTSIQQHEGIFRVSIPNNPLFIFIHAAAIMTDSKSTRALPTSNITRGRQERSKQRGCSSWSNHGCSVYAHPSDGSIVVKSNANIVDMTFLGLNRMAPEKESFQDERKNRFAKLFLKAGRTRRSSVAYWKYSMIVPAALTFEERMENSNDIEASAWIIEDTWQARLDTDDESYLDDDPVVLGKLQMALNIEEKIAVMKELGAKFYPEPRDFPALKNAYDLDWPGKAWGAEDWHAGRTDRMLVDENHRRS